MQSARLWLAVLVLLPFLALLPRSQAVPWSICGSTSCNASTCVAGNVAVNQNAGDGGKISQCFPVAMNSSWFATIACSTTSGVTSYNFFVSNDSDCTLAYTTHAWSGQDGQCAEGTDLTYWATVDCSAAMSGPVASTILISLAALVSLLLIATVG